MISAVWPMPKNSKVSKNEKSDHKESSQFTEASSVTLNPKIEDYIASKQKLIVQSDLDPNLKKQTDFALKELEKLINNLKNKKATIVYNPNGPIPFPKEVVLAKVNSFIGSFDVDDTF
jgi:hypothetical protein